MSWHKIIDDMEEKRKGKSLSLRKLSLLCGVSYATLSRLTRHRLEPSVRSLEKIDAWTYGKQIPTDRENIFNSGKLGAYLAGLEQRISAVEDILDPV